MSITATLIVQIIVFLLLVAFTMKFVWPPIATALDERAKKISEGLAAADRAKAELAAADQRVEQELAKSRADTAQMLADAERRAQAIVEEAKTRAAEEGNKIVAAARVEADQQTVRAREQLREEVAALAVKGAEQILRREVNASVHADLLNRLKPSSKGKAMAELATIARPYAEALYKASQPDLASTSAWLDALAAVAATKQLLQFAENPKVSAQQVFDVVSDVARVQLPQAGQNFLRMVIDNGRLSTLPEIAHQFRLLRNSQSGAADATVFSAFPISAQQLGELTGALEKRFGRKLNLTVQEDPSLIGGIRVVSGDEVLDTSVKARLEQMKVALTA